MAFQRQTRGPIRVRAVGPWRGTPARIHEIDRSGDVVFAEHLPEDDDDLLLCCLVTLLVDDDGLIGYDGDEEDAAAGKKAFVVERLPDGIVAALGGGV